MPLHRLYVPPNLYSAEDKAAIAEAITEVYARLPAFYVVVLFIDISKESYFVGGKRNERFVRIAVQHIARQFPECVLSIYWIEMSEFKLRLAVTVIQQKEISWTDTNRRSSLSQRAAVSTGKYRLRSAM
jgi:phenylpyruvate tautomerase PptA (4-oxalocrotonate tautomerase family)